MTFSGWPCPLHRTLFPILGVSGMESERPSSSSEVSDARVTHSGTGESHLQTSGSQSYLWSKEADKGALRFPSKCLGFSRAHWARGTESGWSISVMPLCCIISLPPCKMQPFKTGEQCPYFIYYEIAFPCANSNQRLSSAIAKNTFPSPASCQSWQGKSILFELFYGDSTKNVLPYWIIPA